jgi:hypothetical protein
MSLPYNFVGGLVSEQTRDFLRPKNTVEKLQLILSLSWFLIAFIGSTELQAFLFVFIIILMLVNYSYLVITKKERTPFINTVAKFGFYFFIFNFMRKPGNETIFLLDFAFVDVIFIQKSIIALLLILGIFLRYIKLELLKPTLKKNIFENYLDFSFQIIKGASYTIFLYVFFDLLDWLSSLVNNQELFPNYQDYMLIIASLLLIISSQAPEGKDLKKIFARELFLVSQTRFERLRDSILKLSIILLFLLNIVPLLTEDKETLISNQIWTDAATILFVIGIITFMMALFEARDNKSMFGNLGNNLSNKANQMFPEKLDAIRTSIKDAEIKTDSQQFFKLNEDISLVDKENSKFIAKKNSIAIPIKETPEGTAVIFVGEGDIENINESGVSTKEILEELATAIIIPNAKWQKAILSLDVIKPSDETIKALALKGIESKEKLLSLAQNTLTDFKNMSNSKIITQKVQGMIDNFQSGKYFVSETKKGTFIRLPGITVIDNKDTTFVRVFGIKVLESQGYTVVNMPFIKVIETPNYQLVNLPGINVIEAGNSNLVNLMGFQILDGDQKEIESARQKIQEESLKLDIAFNQLDQRIDNILDNPDSFLLAKNASGKKIELLTGSTSNKALVSSNLIPESLSKRELRKKMEFEFSSSSSKHRVKPDKKVRSFEEIEELPIDLEPSFESNDESIENESPENQKLNKLYRLYKMSHESIDLPRLAKHLEFNSLDDLETWLLNLTEEVSGLRINWDENKLLINDEGLRGLKRALRKK